VALVSAECIVNNQEEESIVVTPREPFSDAILSENADELAKFMDQPLPAIAEMVTGWLAAGPKSLDGRNGSHFQQVGREIKRLRDAGKIPDD
jgi:hypothetical protein